MPRLRRAGLVRGAKDGANLEEPHVAVPARHVELDPAQQLVPEGGAQMALLGGERVQERHAGVGGRREGGRARLQEAEPHEEAPHPVLHAEPGVVPEGAGARPEGTDLVREGVVAAPACDLLDEVDLAGDIRADSGNRYLQRLPLPADSEADRLEQGGDLPFADLHPEQGPDPLRTKGYARPLEGSGGQIERGAGCRSPGHRADQGDHPLERAAGALRVHSALEPVRGVRREVVTAGGCPHRSRIEDGALQEETGGALPDLGVLAPHHPRERNGALGVRDDQLPRFEIAVFAVERADRLARPGAPDDHRAALEAVQVEGVQRLAELVEHVVGGVHHIVDGTAAHGADPRGQPLRGGGDANALHHGSEVAGAELRLLDPHRDAARGSLHRFLREAGLRVADIPRKG